jgi:RimJ/RimL family protein N-acetyltransferase
MSNMAEDTPDHPIQNVRLREVIESDLPIFFEHQRDPKANQAAAFPARDREAFDAHWAKIMADSSVILQTILYEGMVVGNIVSFEIAGAREVGYWIGREYWGKGIATQALTAFLNLVQARPLYAHVASHNLASIRVLEKCGFIITGEDKYTDEHGEQKEEIVLTLNPEQ